MYPNALYLLSPSTQRENLKESEEEITLLVQENDRLRKLAQEAVDRSNKFLDLAHTLRADRDLTMVIIYYLLFIIIIF